MALTLTGRLLCAARQTYGIIANGIAPASPQTPAPPPSTLVGWVGDALSSVAGLQAINAGLVAETATEIIVAFRGTEPFDSPNHAQMVLDWANDVDAPLVSETGMPGLVHMGFRDALDSLWPIMWPQIQARLAASPGKPLYITGHSKGGAMAPLAAMRCHAAGLAPYVCTFAAARSGDQTFANAYAAAVPHSTRYEFRDDIVPHLPPEEAFVALLEKVPFLTSTVSKLTLGYVSVGTLAFINWQNQIVADSPALQIQRLTHLAQTMFEIGGFDTIIHDHGLDPGSGYASAICPGVWP
jgi:hypothetical protein